MKYYELCLATLRMSSLISWKIFLWWRLWGCWKWEVLYGVSVEGPKKRLEAIFPFFRCVRTLETETLEIFESEHALFAPASTAWCFASLSVHGVHFTICSPEIFLRFFAFLWRHLLGGGLGGGGWVEFGQYVFASWSVLPRSKGWCHIGLWPFQMCLWLQAVTFESCVSRKPALFVTDRSTRSWSVVSIHLDLKVHS